MRRIFILVFLLFSLSILFGCSDSNKTSMLSDYKNSKKESLKYDIEQISFSKSFQSIDSSIDIIENNEDNLKILTHLGLGDYTEVEVSKVLMRKNNIDIYVSGSNKDNKSALAVPQIIINLDKKKLKDIEDIKFNIVYKDFTPINIKFNINDVLNKLESHFKVSPKSSPRFELINVEDDILWEITYNSIFFKDVEDTPLINLYALVDANSGDIIQSEKNIISSVLDTGHILNYTENQNLLYKQIHNDGRKDKFKEELYSYNIVNEETDLLYTSNYKITSGEVSPKLDHVSFIEESDNGNEVYITPYNKPKIYKIAFEDNFNPSIIKWKNNNTLYIMGNENNKSVFYSYDLNTNKLNLIKKINKDIESFSIFNDYFLLIEKSDNEYNKKTYLTKDWKSFKPLNAGFNSKFIDDENIAYISKDKNSNIEYLSVYNLEENKIIRKIDGNVVSYSIFDNNIVYIKNNPNYNDYTMYTYSLDTREKSYVSHVICKESYYNSNDNIIYLNAILPFESHNTEIIYTIDLDNIKNP